LREWHNKYKDEGLIIIGNHYPEFSYEKDLDNLKQAIVDLDIPYAVAQDNDRKTWAAYKNPRPYPLCSYRRRRVRNNRIGYPGIIGRKLSVSMVAKKPPHIDSKAYQNHVVLIRRKDTGYSTYKFLR